MWHFIAIVNVEWLSLVEYHKRISQNDAKKIEILTHKNAVVHKIMDEVIMRKKKIRNIPLDTFLFDVKPKKLCSITCSPLIQ